MCHEWCIGMDPGNVGRLYWPHRPGKSRIWIWIGGLIFPFTGVLRDGFGVLIMDGERIGADWPWKL